ncbi:uncharacterized protein LOC110266427 [Arachis ipaensis]|uniref:uncharacterized protein LOC110266427 n=1 Tax=Arachis ipaensis TaxID=130454 RepID=UPI000A2B0810|nr:uncharacterized protein LOC110266427 [Arachis ipaensis]
MQIFIQSIDYNIWKIIVNGSQVSTKTRAEGVVIPIKEAKWNDKDKKKVELNTKVINSMHCAISFEEYQKVSRCKTAKEIWDKLQVTHEGTKQIKEISIDILRKEYEIFSMKDGETIDQMFERRIRRLMRSKGKCKGSSSKEQKKDLSKVICHHCKEVGHFKFNCSKLKKEDKAKKEKKKVLMDSRVLMRIKTPNTKHKSVG